MIERKYLPSKKFIEALSAAVCIVVLAIVLSYMRPNISLYRDNSITNTSASTSLAAYNIDSDNDGLPDWQKTLYGIDPYNPDMSGDGMLNGEKIKDGLDPFTPNTAAEGQNPNNKLNPAIITNEEKEIQTYESLSPTEKLAEDLISNIIAEQPVNGQMDQDTENSIVNAAIQDIPQQQFTASTTMADLDIIPINQATFQTELSAYITGYIEQTDILQGVLGTDLDLINTDLSTDNTIDTEKLAYIVSQYQSIVNNLIRLPLPANIDSPGAIDDLKVIDDLEEIIAIDNDIIASNNDGAIMYADLAAYANVINDLDVTLGTIDATLGVTRN